MTSRDPFLALRVALEGLASLVLVVGVLWGIAAAARTRKAIAFLGLAPCAVAVAFIVYPGFLSVKAQRPHRFRPPPLFTAGDLRFAGDALVAGALLAWRVGLPRVHRPELILGTGDDLDVYW